MQLKNMTLDELWIEILKDDVEKHPQTPECPSDEILSGYSKSFLSLEFIKHISDCSGCFYKFTLLSLQNNKLSAR